MSGNGHHPEYDESPCPYCGEKDLHLTNDCPGLARRTGEVFAILVAQLIPLEPLSDEVLERLLADVMEEAA